MAQTKKLKVKMVAGMDSDGHFWTQNIFERDAMWGCLMDLEDGDYWANEGFDHDTEEDIIKSHVINLSDSDWEDFIVGHTSRGLMEFV